MLTNLIIVAGHSVYVGKNLNDVFDDTNWFLYPFQKGEPKLYIEHIKTGCDLAKSDKYSLLIFTGGNRERKLGSEVNRKHISKLQSISASWMKN